jgi:hypothetical protein
MVSRSAGWLVAVVLGLGITLGAARAHEAHDLPLDRVMTGFLKVEPREAHLAMRIPLDLLLTVAFPLKNGEYDLSRIGSAVQQSLDAVSRDVTLWSGDSKLTPSRVTGRLAAPGDPSFADYNAAMVHFAAPQDSELHIAYGLGYLDVVLDYPIAAPTAIFTIDNKIAEDLGEAVTFNVVSTLPQGEPNMRIAGGSGPVIINPAWYQIARGFIVFGIVQILSSADHLVFLLCLVIPFQRVKELVPVLLAFVIGYLITLVGTAFRPKTVDGWFPALIAALIVGTIFYLAIENIVGASLRRRWVVAGAFGLIQGFGFADAVKDQLQFSGTHPLLSVFSLGFGLGFGQFVALCIGVPALALLFRGVMAGRVGIIVVSAIIADTSWWWTISRGKILLETPLPPITLASLGAVAQWALVIFAAIGAALLLAQRVEQRWPQLVPTQSRSLARGSGAAASKA